VISASNIRGGHALIEEDPRARRLLRSGSGFGEALLGVPEHRLDLQTSHAGEPGEEVIHSRSVLDVLEERLHRHPRAREDPRAADPRLIAFNGRALRPVQHVGRVTLRCAMRQGHHGDAPTNRPARR
jgi:hypothetical protein